MSKTQSPCPPKRHNDAHFSTNSLNNASTLSLATNNYNLHCSLPLFTRMATRIPELDLHIQQSWYLCSPKPTFTGQL